MNENQMVFASYLIDKNKLIEAENELAEIGHCTLHRLAICTVGRGLLLDKVGHLLPFGIGRRAGQCDA